MITTRQIGTSEASVLHAQDVGYRLGHIDAKVKEIQEEQKSFECAAKEYMDELALFESQVSNRFTELHSELLVKLTESYKYVDTNLAQIRSQRKELSNYIFEMERMNKVYFKILSGISSLALIISLVRLFI
jgi:uncharacterized protein (DUF342 family)